MIPVYAFTYFVYYSTNACLFQIKAHYFAQAGLELANLLHGLELANLLQ